MAFLAEMETMTRYNGTNHLAPARRSDYGSHTRHLVRDCCAFHPTVTYASDRKPTVGVVGRPTADPMAPRKRWRSMNTVGGLDTSGRLVDLPTGPVWQAGTAMARIQGVQARVRKVGCYVAERSVEHLTRSVYYMWSILLVSSKVGVSFLGTHLLDSSRVQSVLLQRSALYSRSLFLWFVFQFLLFCFRCLAKRSLIRL